MDVISVTDIERAESLLLSGGYTCVMCRGDETYTSILRGVAPLLECIDSGRDMRFFSAADKAVGKAAAMLFVLLGVSEVYADVMSEPAKNILDVCRVKYSCNTSVKYIINRAGDGMCPMEKAVMDTDNPHEALRRIRETAEKLRGEK